MSEFQATSDSILGPCLETASLTSKKVQQVAALAIAPCLGSRWQRGRLTSIRTPWHVCIDIQAHWGISEDLRSLSLAHLLV